MSEIIENTIKTLPDEPGVYLMHSADDTVIYVGKAKNLKNRVTQYFRSHKNHTPKVVAMVSHVHRFEYIVTDSEAEALVLECNLIKKYMPKYNILLKDDKHYPFIKITADREFPKIMITRKPEHDMAKYYGPYLNANVARKSIEMLRRLFGIYTCSRKFPRDIGKGRPCLYYHMKQCSGVCTGNVSAEEYNEAISNAKAFLDGRHAAAVSQMEAEMYKASDELKFEKAAALRDSIEVLKGISEKQKAIVNNNLEQDFIAYASDGEEACIQVFFVRDGKLSGRDNFKMKNTESERLEEIYSQFILQFYAVGGQIPKTIYLMCEPDEKEILEEWLSGLKGSKVAISVPQRGEKRKMLDMAEANAVQAIEAINLTKTRERAIMLELKSLLSLAKMPRIIECYDISHTAGADSVGGMVSYYDTHPKKSSYRKFKIESAAAADDYGAMSEVVFRRINRALEGDEKFLPLPDLILLDGGRGQVSTVRKLLANIGVSVPVFGLAKDDKHRTKEITSDTESITVPIRPKLFRFLANMQEEVHRYAIGYHKNLHKKSTVKSGIESIPGIGPAKHAALLEYFKSVENIRAADKEALSNVKGINPDLAERIYEYFRKNNV